MIYDNIKMICKAESIEIIHRSVYNLVNTLYYINKVLEIDKIDLRFAKKLLSAPLDKRAKWLKQKIIERSDDFVTYQDLVKKLEEIIEWGE